MRARKDGQIMDSTVFDKATMLSQVLGDHPEFGLVIILLGFMGGTISGFIGSGGAFLMTPGMMNKLRRLMKVTWLWMMFSL